MNTSDARFPNWFRLAFHGQASGGEMPRRVNSATAAARDAGPITSKLSID